MCTRVPNAVRGGREVGGGGVTTGYTSIDFEPMRERSESTNASPVGPRPGFGGPARTPPRRPGTAARTRTERVRPIERNLLPSLHHEYGDMACPTAQC
jgi:hypothetical protein